ncbi:MAG: hypothetical protein LBH40_04635 [Alphaproteobacteria bacterium]|jgi:hypothetical protein|nr:hypothetical protein [Alphaproteobacteria bacterium]
MQAKNNSNKDFQIINQEEGLVKVSIKDGYIEGDALNLDLSGVNYTWNSENKELLIATNIDNTNIYNILDNISLSSINQANQTERFIEVEYIKDGETLTLEEYALNINNTEEISVEVEEDSAVVPQVENTYISEDTEIFLSFDYEENKGADFLESSIEENFLFEVNLKENGDIYKILKDSFESTDVLEIHGLNISQDKVSLEEFTKDFGDSFNYSVSARNDDLNVNIHVENHEYNVVLKDVVPDSDTKLDDIIQNIIINSSDHKI